ncbi:MFS transporter [Jeotgalibacillus sp. R-1-5s-1]|uniref:MFS transporter n=1 Tax=Jeotgalibacillus sp. R-1-5s-1 TaxID=2555897 RepID=UPI001069F61C|nr:MFS transporter [Jeotgalibacillus sp. R-1-5s-1]TFD94489.1 MFS transporter [Jeotgalibacillus sp. R-1-5s-1]
MRNHSFRFLWMGQSLANLGDVFYIVSLISTIYLLTGSAVYIALLPFFSMSARFFGALAAPYVMDRYSLPSLLACSQGGKTLLLLVLAISYPYLTKEAILVTFLFVIGIAFLDGWATPASYALIPRLVEKERLVKANGWMGVVTQTIQLSAWPLGGILVAFWSPESVMWMTVSLYAGSAMLAGMLAKRHTVSAVQGDHSSKDRRAGWKAIWKSPFLRLVTFVDMIEVNAGVVWVAAIMYVYVAEVLQTSEAWWGYINSSFFAGLIIGGLIAIKVDQLLHEQTRKVVILTAWIGALSTLTFGLITNPWTALVLSALFGFASQIKGITQDTLLQLKVKEHELPKVYAAQEAVSFSTYAISTLLAGVLVEAAGVRFVFLLAGGMLIFGAVLVVVFRRFIIFESVKNPS